MKVRRNTFAFCLRTKPKGYCHQLHPTGRLRLFSSAERVAERVVHFLLRYEATLQNEDEVSGSSGGREGGAGCERRSAGGGAGRASDGGDLLFLLLTLRVLRILVFIVQICEKKEQMNPQFTTLNTSRKASTREKPASQRSALCFTTLKNVT